MTKMEEHVELALNADFMDTNITTAIGLIVLAIALLIASPIISIWALNTLFALNIPTTVATWFAVLWIQLIFGGNVAARNPGNVNKLKGLAAQAPRPATS